MTPKNRPGRPSKGRADTIDDVLLTAARDLFCTHGVTGTSMDDIARARPAFLFLEERMIDDDPEFIIGKVDRLPVFVPGSPCIGTDQDDPLDQSRLWRLNLRGIEQAAQDAGDTLDFALLAPDEMADARHHDFARGNVVR